MSFAAPYWWMLGVPLAAFMLWVSRASYAQLTPRTRWISLTLRALVVVLLLAALSQPSYTSRSSRQHVVVLLDVSESVSPANLEAAIDDIDQLLRKVSQDDRPVEFSVVLFGERAEMPIASQSTWEGFETQHRDLILHNTSDELLNSELASLIGDSNVEADAIKDLEDRIANVKRFQTDIVRESTDVEPAMRLALNCGPPGVPKTIYVYTDAQFNRGDWSESWSTASAEEATVHLVKLDRAAEPDVALATIDIPQRVRVNEGFSARINVVSNHQTNARLDIFKDGYLQESRDVALDVGDNPLDIGGFYFREKGFHRVAATITAQSDEKLQNNRGHAMISVPGPVRVLYVDKDDAQIPYLRNALELEGMSVDARPASGIPSGLAELLNYDALILSNISADYLSAAQMRAIRSYVKDFGGGFLMLGGDESFGLGGYFGTPIEEILPVRMPIQKDLNRPSLALVLVIDKSGSMDGAKMDLAKRAAMATAQVINPLDQVGVVGFDSVSKVVLEMTSAVDQTSIANQISTLTAGGGTFMFPAIQEAHSMLQTVNARRKHIIILSDGQTEGSNYDLLVESLAAEGITVSTVGIGGDADINLLKAIADAGNGRHYFTDDFYRIPQIFTREALRASKNMLVEQLVLPTVVADDACLREIEHDWIPPLTGYVATTPRLAATTIMVAESGDPILARWRYGLGHTVAFTSETKPRWAEDWIDWEDFAKFWSQLVRSVTTESRGEVIGVEFQQRIVDEGVIVGADIRDSLGEFVEGVMVECRRVDDQGRIEPVSLVHVAAGYHETEALPHRFGESQQFVWTIIDDEDREFPIPFGFVRSFSPEFQTLGVAHETVEQIERYDVGESMPVGQARLRLDDRDSTQRVKLLPYLLVAAIVCIPFDILCRRLGHRM